jgi:hypothetical protein
MEIAMDFADVVMVGGMEHMTRVPMGGPLIDRGAIKPNMSLFMAPEYQHWDMMTSMNMGLTAEKLFAKNDFTKEDMDKWGVRSHQRAAKGKLLGNPCSAAHDKIVDLLGVDPGFLDEFRQKLSQQFVSPHFAEPVPGGIVGSRPGLGSSQISGNYDFFHNSTS